MTITQDIWEGCYRGGWGDLLGQSSMAHPAKMARGLAARIYEHVLEEQWIQAGGRVIDPFGGIAGTAFHAMVHGLVWQGVELEPRFVAWGQGMDCDGSACPQCAKEIKAGEQQAQMFERAPHRFAGNIETWEKKGLPGTARLVQGDSRKLREVLNNADLSVTSPPYEKSVKMRSGHLDQGRLAAKGLDPQCNGHTNGQLSTEQYGRSEGQVGNLPNPEGSLDVALSSPPYGQRTVHGQAGIDFSRSEVRDRTGHRSQADTQDQYGEKDGNLGNMPMSDHALSISSPPYGHDTVNSRNGIDEDSLRAKYRVGKTSQATNMTGYGDGEEQIANLPATEEGLECAITSPPYSGNSGKHDRTGHERAQRRHERLGFKQGVGCFKTGEAYGDEDGQLGAMDEGDIDVVLTSKDQALFSRASECLSETCDALGSSSLPLVDVQGVFLAIVSALDSYSRGGRDPYRDEDDPGGKWPEVLASYQRLLCRLLPNAQWYAVNWTSLLSSDTDCTPCRDSYGEPLRFVAESSQFSLQLLIDALRAFYRQVELCKCIPACSCTDASCAVGERLLTELVSLMLGEIRALIIRLSHHNTNGFSAAISSPPFPQQHFGGGGLNVEGYSKNWQKNDMKDLVGNRTYQGRGADRAEGNLEVMPADDYEASITSPPYEHDSEPHGDLRPDNGSQAAVFVERDYGATEGDLSAKPETFWSASRTILEQLFEVLKPGGHAVFVTGDFVRDRQRVRFGEQWRQLCEAVGFVCLHHHIASKTDARGTQGLLDGGEVEQQSSKISFFRRNHIDNERAAIHWSSIENQADYLTQAETKLRKEYDKRVAAKKSAVPVTEARILQVAQKTAWREGGAPAHDTDIAILNEDVWCFLRP